MKIRKSFYLSLCLGLYFIFSSIISFGQHATVNINVSGIKSKKGQIVLSTFKNSESFAKENPYKKIKFDKKDLINGSLELKCTLDVGVCGIVILDDENSNEDMDKNFLRMPKEGFGFSNYYMQSLKRVSFEEFKLNLNNGINNVQIKVKYL
ncbi:uncharacterized protein (DUF2141 family) [Arcicella rosea]|uniref:DUF2141 domain-containing protein n=1 Tax=Arcicella rosea TaxID=502909 RepID=UPI00345D84E7